MQLRFSCRFDVNLLTVSVDNLVDRCVDKVFGPCGAAMTTVFDVANYIIAKRGAMSAMKLQKLVYYAQAWTLTWTEQELFPEEIEAWANGPVVRELYLAHRGEYRITTEFSAGNKAAVTDEQAKIIDKVLSFYGDKDPQWLSDLTHMEAPWKNARVGIPDGTRSEAKISKESLLEYYSSL